MLAKNENVTKVNEKQIFQDAKEAVYGSKRASSRQIDLIGKENLNKDLFNFDPLLLND